MARGRCVRAALCLAAAVSPLLARGGEGAPPCGPRPPAGRFARRALARMPRAQGGRGHIFRPGRSPNSGPPFETGGDANDGDVCYPAGAVHGAAGRRPGASAAPQGAPGVLHPAHKEAGAAQKGAPARTQAGAGGKGACGAKARPPAGPEAAPGPAPSHAAHGTRRMPLQEKLDAVDEYRTGDSLYTVAARHGIALAAAQAGGQPHAFARERAPPPQADCACVQRAPARAARVPRLCVGLPRHGAVHAAPVPERAGAAGAARPRALGGGAHGKGRLPRPAFSGRAKAKPPAVRRAGARAGRKRGRNTKKEAKP